jgi:hypothetical protein
VLLTALRFEDEEEVLVAKVTAAAVTMTEPVTWAG